MKNYSQVDEQANILRYFGAHKGAFLDIGANDGQTFSNTYALALMGWQGTSVDASPRAFKSLVSTSIHVRIQCINAAITDYDGRATLHEASDTLVSSLDAAQEEAWKHHGFEWAPVEVEAMTFKTLMERSTIKTFDFISIDAEGHDLIILEQMDLKALGCRLICVEHAGRFAEIKALCPGFKEYHRNGINLLLHA